MLKFGGGEEIKPGLGAVGTEDVEIRFYLLVGAFSLSVCLGVVGSGEFDIVLKESSQLTSEGRCELGSSVRYYGIV